MCLTCAKTRYPNAIAAGKKELAEVFKYSRHKTYIYTHDNRVIQLNDAQIDEIIENALAMVCTGVDLSCDIWALQWPRDYKVKTIDLKSV